MTRSAVRFLAISLAILPLGACMTVMGGGMTGMYGGDHVLMTLGASGGTMEFDCASATIGPIRPGGGGMFTAPGTYQRGGGPIRAGTRTAQPATFQGRADPTSITIRARLADGSAIGPYRLVRDVRPTLYNCY